MDEILTQIEQYRDQFYRFVLRNVWDSSVADDVFASAVLAAYENRHKFTPGTNFRAWMFKILVNKCFVANRETKRTFEPLDEESGKHVAADQSAAHLDNLKDPKGFLEQCGDEVYHALRRLSTAQRTCILLKDVERFSYQDIAETLGIPAATVMTHLARGRAALRRQLHEYAVRNGIVRPLPRLVSREENDERRIQGSIGSQ
jgi:RNA polymerase sigma-70 factor (ECF subfamily)